MMRKCIRKSKGYTLVELLSYMALFGVALSLIYSIFYQFSRTIAAAELTIVNERKTYGIVKTLQDDFHRSSGTLDRFGPFRASDHCLLLALQGQNDAEIAIYRFDKSRGTLTRFASMGDEKHFASHIAGESITEFAYSLSPQDELLKVSLETKKRFYGSLEKKPLIFYAAARSR
jgi:type II secretory pathway pseudopilin PulG